MTNRNYKDVAAAMLRIAAEQKSVKRVDMLYGTRASNSKGSALLNRVIDARLLKEDNKVKKKNRYYCIIKDGQRFLKAYDVIMELLSSRNRQLFELENMIVARNYCQTCVHDAEYE
ncbi:MAG: hypothetical protein ABI347_02845 [Nitrososphaera sp.]